MRRSCPIRVLIVHTERRGTAVCARVCVCVCIYTLIHGILTHTAHKGDFYSKCAVIFYNNMRLVCGKVCSTISSVCCEASPEVRLQLPSLADKILPHRVAALQQDREKSKKKKKKTSFLYTFNSLETLKYPTHTIHSE